MKHRPEIDLLAEAYTKIYESHDMPTMAVIEVQPKSAGLPDGHCAAASCGCDCDDCPECRDNQQDDHTEHDQSEIHMAKAELRKAAEYAQKLSEMLDSLNGLEGWTASKITKASDYLSSVYHWLDYETNQHKPQGMFNQGVEDCGHNH